MLAQHRGSLLLRTAATKKDSFILEKQAKATQVVLGLKFCSGCSGCSASLKRLSSEFPETSESRRYILSLTKFQNRVLVFFQWAFNYLTFNRSARLITAPGNGNDLRAAVKKVDQRQENPSKPKEVTSD